MIVLMAAANVLSGLVLLYTGFADQRRNAKARLSTTALVILGAIGLSSGAMTLIMVLSGVPLGTR